MARKLDLILVVDVESTCWDGHPLEGEEREVIEIGLCVVTDAQANRGLKGLATSSTIPRIMPDRG